MKTPSSSQPEVTISDDSEVAEPDAGQPIHGEQYNVADDGGGQWTG